LKIAIVPCINQPDVGVQHRAHQPSRGARIAVRDRHGRLLVQAEQHLRPLVAEVVDDAVVQAAVARAGVEREVRDVERAQHGSDGVTAIDVFLNDSRNWDVPHPLSLP
jgi:hypothetical protein